MQRDFVWSRAWLVRSNTRPCFIGWEGPVDRRWILRESGMLEAKNSSYTTTPCASPEWGWSSHREPVCTLTTFNYDNAWPSWSSHAMLLLSLLAFQHSRRCPPVMTPDNSTGNFVLTPSVSTDANRGASSLLPHSVTFALYRLTRCTA